MEVLYTYHPAWIFVACLLAALYSVGLYYREKVLSDLNKKIKWALAATRFLTVFFIAILLLGIIFEGFDSKKEKPLLFIAQDNSESIVQNKDSVYYKTKYLESLEELVSKLKDKFEVINYSFSDLITSEPQMNYSDKITDISNVLNQIYDQYNNRNIGAIVLSSDGIYNQGANPVYTVSRKPYVPVFTIGLGDTAILKDILVRDIVHNEIAFLGNQFPVKIDIDQTGFSGKSVKVEILEGSKLVFSEQLKFEKSSGITSTQFNLKANATGFRRYTVKVSELEGEFTFKNNISNFYINVIDGRQKILLTYSGIHPDISALNYVIKKNKNYEVVVKSISEIEEDLNQYDLIIVHSYKSGNKRLEELIALNTKPVLFIVGVNSEIEALTKASIGFSGRGGNFEDISFLNNSRFNEIIFSDQTIKTLEDAPPLRSSIGTINFSGSIKTAAYQKVGSIGLTKPLIYFSEKGNNKYGVIFGEGIWRWRLFDQARTESTTHFEELISKMINYLAIKENKDPFKVEIKNEYDENEKIAVRAELYNASFELINSPEVSFELRDADSSVLTYHFYKTNTAYKLDLGRLDEGVYTWVARTSLNDANYKKSGTFLVREVKRELLNLTADHRLLNNISENTNGRFFNPKALNELSDELLNRKDIVSVVYQEKTFSDFIDYKWLFILIIVLLTFEWFVRKYQGGY